MKVCRIRICFFVAYSVQFTRKGCKKHKIMTLQGVESPSHYHPLLCPRMLVVMVIISSIKLALKSIPFQFAALTAAAATAIHWTLSDDGESSRLASSHYTPWQGFIFYRGASSRRGVGRRRVALLHIRPRRVQLEFSFRFFDRST